MLARMVTSSFKRLPRAVREQQMLDAAVRVFSRRGFHAASMDEVAEEAGISKPMVYAYLGAKDQLFVACLHREGTRLLEAIAAEVGAGGLPPDEQLWRGLRAFFRFVGAHRDGWAVLYRQARADVAFAAELARMRRRIVEVVAGMLARVVAAQGLPVREAELEATAYALVGAGESLADWLADHSEEDPERTATRMMNVSWLGADQLLRGEVWRPPSS
ncbi:MAG TPA: TetR/AcrR family transcriptional regulator [Micromonosporaceae bacterium]|nr:TetR/AcrR family transcriptional regulator [Micromonosporaceae bacterium]